MVDRSRGQITELLTAWSGGDPDALARLIPLVYNELHQLARHYMQREHPRHTLQASALVNEVYLRIVDSSRVQWQDRAHFVAVAAQLMRRVLVDFARTRRSQKRGGEWVRVTLSESAPAGSDVDLDIVALHEALEELARLDPRKAKVVELRFFGGLSLAETSEVLQISTDTLGRDWNAAKAWLLRQMKRKA